MYTENDMLLAEKQEKKRILVFIIISIVFLTGIITSFIFRIRLLTMGLSILYGFFAIFYISMLYMPVFHYKKTLQLMLTGRKRSIQGLIKAISHDKIIRDNFECISITVKTGEDRHGDDDVDIFLDVNKQLPLQVGDTASFTLFDRIICDWRAE